MTVSDHLGVRPEKKLLPRKLWKTIPDSVVTFFFQSWDLCCSGAQKGPCGAACLLLACLLDAQAPPWWSNNLMNRLKYYVLQLGDPNPSHVMHSCRAAQPTPLPPLTTHYSPHTTPPFQFPSPSPRAQLLRRQGQTQPPPRTRPPKRVSRSRKRSQRTVTVEVTGRRKAPAACCPPHRSARTRSTGSGCGPSGFATLTLIKTWY